MKSIIKSILILALVCHTGLSFAQSSGPDYTLESGTISLLGESVPIFSTISKAGTTVAWQQLVQDNESTALFNIGTTSGDWDPNTNTGTLAHQISSEGLYGLLTLKSTDSGLIVILDITDEQTLKQQQYTLVINSITYQ